MKKFNAQACLEAFGLEEGGRVQRAIDSEVLRVSEPYIPRDLSAGAGGGGLIQSGLENTVIGSGEVVWKTPYAHYVHEGIVYVDPQTNSAGFLTDEGWKSRKGASKVPTERELQYQGAPVRGHHWVDRCMQDGGIKQVEKAAQEAADK